MEKLGPVRAMIARSALILLLMVLSGCTFFAPAPPEPVVIADPVPAAEPEPEVQPEPEPEPAPPPPAPEPVAEPRQIGPLVAVVLSDRTPAFVDVATALGKYLDNHEIYDLSDRSLPPREAFATISATEASAVVAVGMRAAKLASRFATVPVVVGQVFNINDSELLSPRIKAVAVLPPIGLQIDAWRELDPSLRNVGAILGPGHEDLIAEADRAMQERGVKFHYAIAESDRETLYLFNRLVRDIDGFLLFPDNRILSRNVLNEMMGYASRHRVQVAVFNEPLLEFGAAFAAKSVDKDIAATIARLLDEMINGDIDAVAPVTGLSEIEISTNPSVLRRFGLGTAEVGLTAETSGAK